MIPDPAGDDHGPGTYVYPSGDAYRPGSFDLRELRLVPDGDEVVVEAHFARAVPVERGVRLSRSEVADLFLPTVDVYLDIDRGRATGERRALRGRRVRMPEGAGWEVALVLSPVPARLRTVLGEPPPGTAVWVPERVRLVRGRVLQARVPRALLAGVSLDRVGVAAAVTGTVFASTFRALVPEAVPTAFVREVTEDAGRCGEWEEEMDGTPCTFGGCRRCGVHPRVIDALHPEPGVQEEALSSHDPDTRRPATLPMVLPDGEEAGPQTPAVRVERRIADRREGMVTVLLGDAPAPPVGALLDAYDEADRRVGTVVVASVHPEGPVVLRVVDGDAERIARIRWTAPAE
ncbi:MAG: glucodextranase DOMON-like domain-containing protein [Myxococcota bacterium]